MDLFLALGQMALGMALLLVGAELFTEQAVKAARALRVTTLAMGLLFAGAEPEELFTASIAAGRQAPGIALGDVIGTNVTIIALALGLAALILPIGVDRGVRRHGVITFLVALPALAFLLRGLVPLWGGIVLVLLYFGYIFHIIYRERLPIEMAEMSSEKVAAGLANPGPLAKRERFLVVALVVISLAVMGGGGHFTVEGARDLAGWLGVTESSVGLSLVAFATSAEMLFLAVVPVLKGHPEISLGGILGSYVYNVTLTLGVASLVGPLLAPEPRLIRVSSLFMVGLLALLLLMLSRGRLGRLDGAVLVLLYAAYLATVFVL